MKTATIIFVILSGALAGWAYAMSGGPDGTQTGMALAALGAIACAVIAAVLGIVSALA